MGHIDEDVVGSGEMPEKTMGMSLSTEPQDERFGDPIVRVRDLGKIFVRSGGDPVRAIDGVSFDVAPGEFAVLLGPSGCGKTTLLRAIAGLETPDEGSVELHGETVFASTERINVPPERRRISMVFQSYALWPHMTAFDNVAYPLTVRSRSRPRKSEIADRVNHVLGLVGIPTLGGQYPSQLSGGQQQRVALARALVVGTDLVLFDEPLSNVDAKVRESLRIELLSMQERLGFAALFVTHDQTEAMILADRIAVLETGKIVQFGPPDEIYSEPRSRYVANFIGTTNELPGRVVSVEARGGAVISTDLGEVRGIAGGPGVDSDTDVVAVWRPEVLEVSLEEPQASNRWRGRIEATLFLGSHTEYLVSVDGTRFQVWTTRMGGLDNGDDVWLSVAPERVRVLSSSAPN